jgi:hypothetical protein
MTEERPTLSKAKRDRQSGAIFAVGLLVLLLLAASLVAGLRYLGPKTVVAQQTATERRMSTSVQKSLWQFVSKNFRLPCPADGTLPSTDPTWGQEKPIGGGACTITDNRGVVPWRTLGLQPSDAQDGWGHLLGYAATPALTSSATLPFKTQIPPSATNGLSVTDNVSAAANYAYVLISFVPDGGGAYTLSGTRLPATANPTETANTAAGGASPFVSGSGNSFWSQPTTAAAQAAIAGTPPMRFGHHLVFENAYQICRNINNKSLPLAKWSSCSPTTVEPTAASTDTAHTLFRFPAATGYLGSLITSASSANPMSFVGCSGTFCSSATGSLTLLSGLGTVSVSGPNTNGISTGNPYVAVGDWIGANNANSCLQCPYNSINPAYLIPGQTLTYAYNSSFISFAFVDFLMNGGSTVQVTAYGGTDLSHSSTWVKLGTLNISNGRYISNTPSSGVNPNPACLGPSGGSSPPWLTSLQSTFATIPANNAYPNENTITASGSVAAWAGYPPPELAQQWPTLTFGTTISNYNGAFDNQFASRTFVDEYGDILPFNIVQFQLLPYVDATGAVDTANASGQYNYGMLFEGMKACPTYASETATIGGKISAGDTVSITFTNSGIAGLPVKKSYTVSAADTTTTIAAGLASLINQDTTLRTASFWATNYSSATNNFGSTLSIIDEGSVTTAGSTVLSATVTGSATETVVFSSAGNKLSTLPGTNICDMRGNAPAPTYSSAIYPAGDQWWNPPTTATMDCSLQNGLHLQ